VTISQSDHLTGKCEKRPALLGEVDGGRALATTRLYPALFSTVGSCQTREPVRFSKRPAQSPHVAVCGEMGARMPPCLSKGYTGANRGQRWGNGCVP